MILRRLLSVPILLILGLAAVAHAQVGPEGAVRVSVARANVRSEPSLRGTVLTQVTRDTVLPVQAVDGDWFQVRIAMGGIRFDAYISGTVVERIRETEPEGEEGSPGATRPAEPRYGMTLGFLPVTGGSRALAATALGVARVGGDERSLEVIGRSLPEPGSLGAPRESGRDRVTWIWVAPSSAEAPSLDDPQPRFIVSVGGLSGVAPDTVDAHIVRLVPSPDGRRVVAAAPGRADQAVRDDDDWDLVDDLRQDLVPTITTRLEPGTLNLQPRQELGPGEYAVVVRPISSDELSGAAVLTEQGAGQVFATAWLFSVRPR